MKILKAALICTMIICALSGCNIQNVANKGAYDGGNGIPLSDFGGNIAFAASAETDGKLSEFSTSFDPSITAKGHNIEMAAAAINGQIIYPGHVFSFNDAVGPTKKERGFRLARIFVRGKDSEGYGGGVCQVSSTLFNAAEAAGLRAVERHIHSKAVEYVPEGRDAATSYGYKDLKIENSREFPVMINAVVSEGKVTVEIMRV